MVEEVVYETSIVFIWIFSGTGNKSCFISNACDLDYMGKETNKFSDLKYPRFVEFSNHVYTLPYKLLEQQQLYIFF